MKLLILAYCNILVVPDEIGALKNLKTLHLASNELTDDTLPSSDTWRQLTNLRELNLSKNNLVSLDFTLDLPQLASLDASYNEITKIPENIDSMTNLQRLNLRNNNVAAVATSMLKMRGKLVLFNL